VSGPQTGDRGVDGHTLIKGIKRHILTCSLGFVLAVLVTPANVHDTQAAGPVLDRAAAQGGAPRRVKGDGIDTGERRDAAAARHDLDVQVSPRPPEVTGVTPLPIPWRIETTFGTQTHHSRRLTRTLEPSATAAENAVEIANFHRVLKAYCRVSDCQT
jgi:transposase